MASLECRNCNYYGYSYDEEGNATTTYEHCCFREWGHGDWETAPCDEDDYYEEEESDYEY